MRRDTENRNSLLRSLLTSESNKNRKDRLLEIYMCVPRHKLRTDEDDERTPTWDKQLRGTFHVEGVVLCCEVHLLVVPRP